MADPAPPAKLGWGGYFASYVKKKPPVVPAAATPVPKADETPEKISAPDIASLAIKSVVVEKAQSTILARKPTDGFQRANNGAKKLYEISTEPVVQKAFSAQRSVSNASRLASMFGMAKSTSNDPSPDIKPELPAVSLVAMDIDAQVAKKPEPKVTDTPVIEKPELKLMGAQVVEESETKVMEAPVVTKPEPKVMPIADAVLKNNEGIPPVLATTKSKKDEVQDMLDFFASQLDSPGDILALPGDSTTKISKPEATEIRRTAKKKPGRAKPKAVDMLDFLASQLDSASDIYALPGDKKADTPRTEPSSTLPKAEEESTLQNGLTAAKPVPKTAIKPEPIVREIPQVLQKAAGTATLARRDSIWSRQGSQKSTEMVKVVEERKSTTSSTSSELKRAMNGRKDSVWSRQSSRTSSELSTIISDRKSQLSEDIDEQIKLERQRMDADRERMIQLEKQAEDIISERTQMDIERQNMLEEQRRFEAEARRIAEEEKSMQAFIENVERERQLDFENQEKKRRRKEAEDQARREAEEKERIRVAEEQEAERLRIQAEEDARRSAELAAEIEAAREAERAEREIKNERRRVEEQRRSQDEADRLAREEAQRLTAEMARYKDETKKDDAVRQTRRTAGEREERQRYEDEAAEEETRSRQIQRENRRAAEEREEQLRYEKLLADKEAQAREDKRSEKQMMRAADRFTNRDYEQEKEKRPGPLREAEEKIRKAFAGLEEERAQSSAASNPAVLARSNTTRDDNQKSLRARSEGCLEVQHHNRRGSSTTSNPRWLAERTESWGPTDGAKTSETVVESWLN
ncbi:hypothetical protein QTJ16_003417 [Diplocarpon rosae]|uniref:Uncharacterized protein n=1 Tax=Diplocarpon rosae TaxID=946125 RepID=A0AAD9WFK5_9HELO|nr:hypothetical protein QTJ16_003417 [Diplocarpon rosae]